MSDDITIKLKNWADFIRNYDSDAETADIILSATNEIERLRAGGCARNQRTTQFCAEASDAIARATATEARAVEAERQLAAAREALRGLLQCPALADGNHMEPAWYCEETVAAERAARAALSDAFAPASAEPAP